MGGFPGFVRKMPGHPRLKWVTTPLVIVFAFVISFWPHQGQSITPVDLILVLAIDVSGSVDQREYVLQRRGFARAFRDPRVLKAIAYGPTRRIAVTAIQWAGANKQFVSIPWSILQDKAGVESLSDKLQEMPRRYSNGQTDISGLIEFASAIALSAPVSAARRVIDISGDGLDNVRFSTRSERDAAIRAGLTINGLAILNETPKLDEYYLTHVVGGPESFVIKANDYDAFAEAILKKLLKEINLRFSS